MLRIGCEIDCAQIITYQGNLEHELTLDHGAFTCLSVDCSKVSNPFQKCTAEHWSCLVYTPLGLMLNGRVNGGGTNVMLAFALPS